MTRIFLRLALALAVCLLFSISARAQSGRQPNRSLFGVALTSKTSTLLTELEQAFGKPIRQEWLPANQSFLGRAVITDDGTPVLKIKRKEGQTLDVIVHELYHFKQRLLGYPVLQLSMPHDTDRKTLEATGTLLRDRLYDPILHYIFYPEARSSLGIDPGKTTEQVLRKSLKDQLGTKVTADREHVALNYFKIHLEGTDLELSRQVLALYANHEGITLGESLVRIVRETKPSAPKEAISTLLACANLLFRERAAFHQSSWTSRQLGKYSQQIVLIDMDPVR